MRELCLFGSWPTHGLRLQEVIHFLPAGMDAKACSQLELDISSNPIFQLQPASPVFKCNPQPARSMSLSESIVVCFCPRRSSRFRKPSSTMMSATGRLSRVARSAASVHLKSGRWTSGRTCFALAIAYESP